MSTIQTAPALPHGFFRPLDTNETEVFRQWARKNYDAYKGEVNPTWHPVVREEFGRISAERKLADLAKHAYNGASNVLVLAAGLGEAAAYMTQPQFRESVEVKVIVGQLSFLLGETLGPSHEVLNDYEHKTGYTKI